MSKDEISFVLLPLFAAPGDPESGMLARQFANQLATELFALGLDATFAPMMARDEEGKVAWFVRDDPWTLDDVRDYFTVDDDKTVAVLGWLKVVDGELEAEIVAEQLMSGHRVLEARVEGLIGDARAALRGLRDNLAGLVDADTEAALVCDSWTASGEAFIPLLGHQDVDSFLSAGGQDQPGADPVRFLRRVLEIDPDSIHGKGLWLARSIGLIRSGGKMAGLALIQERIDKDGESADLMGAFAEGLAVAKRFDEAEEAFSKTIALDPNFAWAYFRLASLRMLVEDWPSAAALLRRAAALDPSEPRIRQQLGIALAELGEAEEAEAVWSALVAEPGVPEDVLSIVETGREMLRLRSDGGEG